MSGGELRIVAGNAIIGFSETMLKYPMMHDGKTLPSAYETDSSQIHTSGQELLKLINDILDPSKVDAGKLEIRVTLTVLLPLIENVMQTATGLVSKKPIKLPADLPPICRRCWPMSSVRQVLFNLWQQRRQVYGCRCDRADPRAGL
ncbi:MAG: hypothetical protein IPK19_16710 [Chloroflexi bacterium]|nr:hypothetical protein [Chloroflexota bacterium]